VIHRLAHRLLVNSEAIRACIVKNTSALDGKITVIKNGVGGNRRSPANAREEICRGLNVEPNAKLIGVIARLQPVKGHRYLIDAAAKILTRETNTHFVLFGDGPLRSDIEAQIAHLGVADRVHLLGDRTDAAQLIPGFDLLVLASLHEGSPNAVMEAMAAGVLVVATGVGGTSELIVDGETGYLAPPGDSARLAGRILHALSDKDDRELIVSTARRRINDEHGMERMVASVERVYAELMSSEERVMVAARTAQRAVTHNAGPGEELIVPAHKRFI
jgi:glycosyltransferase involved in cell wall biosynthesis